jgi:hypothetical protein
MSIRFLPGFVLIGSLVAGYAMTGFAETGFVTVIKARGEVLFSKHGSDWKTVAPDTRLVEGCSLKTGANSSADLWLDYNGSVLRLVGDSELELQNLSKLETGIDVITETQLKVKRGSLVGAQRKLHRPSVLAIRTPFGEATIVGTEYVVNQQGAVSVLSGSVDVTYNLPGNKGSIKVTVAAGQTFDPGTGKVAATTPAQLQNVLADVNAVRQNAEVYKIGKATLVVKAQEDCMSPTTPKGNNGVGNGVDPQPPGNPPVNDGPGTGPGNPGNKSK